MRTRRRVDSRMKSAGDKEKGKRRLAGWKQKKMRRRKEEEQERAEEDREKKVESSR